MICRHDRATAERNAVNHARVVERAGIKKASREEAARGDFSRWIEMLGAPLKMRYQDVIDEAGQYLTKHQIAALKLVLNARVLQQQARTLFKIARDLESRASACLSYKR